MWNIACRAQLSATQTDAYSRHLPGMDFSQVNHRVQRHLTKNSLVQKHKSPLPFLVPSWTKKEMFLLSVDSTWGKS